METTPIPVKVIKSSGIRSVEHKKRSILKRVLVTLAAAAILLFLINSVLDAIDASVCSQAPRGDIETVGTFSNLHCEEVK